MTEHAPIEFQPSGHNGKLLRTAFGRFATGVTIVTAPSPDGPVAITVNSFSSVSLDPALVLWAPDKTTRRFRYFEKATHYAVHVLSSQQSDLCQMVARDTYALRDMPHRANTANVPLIAGCLARFECERVSAIDAGDHLIVVGQVQNIEMREGDALAFYAGKFGELTAA